MSQKKDLTGMAFGRLTVLCEYGKNKYNQILYLCQCKCGNFRIVQGRHLTSEHTTSCGCLKKDKTSRANKKDLTGLKFGRWTVLCEYGRDKHRNVTWLCECSCGNFKIVTGSSLINGDTQSCGCLSKKDLTGLKFGRLTVIKDVGKDKWGAYVWHCRCDCGNEVDVLGGSLTSGNTTSCGCYFIESISGENHPHWQGGISFEPYCTKFNKAKKEEIREKYNNKCLICGKGEKENGKKLSVHHIDQNKDQGCNGHGWDLVPLCMKCHGKVHSLKNEEFYVSLIRARMRIYNI